MPAAQSDLFSKECSSDITSALPIRAAGNAVLPVWGEGMLRIPEDAHWIQVPVELTRGGGQGAGQKEDAEERGGNHESAFAPKRRVFCFLDRLLYRPIISGVLV